MRRQSGMSLLAMLFALVVAGFFLTVGLKLFPHYMDFLTVRSVMKDVAEDQTLVNGGKMSFHRTIQDRLYINSIRSIDPKVFSYRKTSDGYLIGVDYRVQEHLFANLDVILSFNHEVAANKP